MLWMVSKGPTKPNMIYVVRNIPYISLHYTGIRNMIQGIFPKNGMFGFQGCVLRVPIALRPDQPKQIEENQMEKQHETKTESGVTAWGLGHVP